MSAFWMGLLGAMAWCALVAGLYYLTPLGRDADALFDLACVL